MSGLAVPTKASANSGAALREAKLFGYRVTIASREAVIDWLMTRREGRQATAIVTLNPEMLMLARTDQALAAAIRSADLTVADGVGIVWALGRLAGVRAGRYPGIEMAQDLLRALAGSAGRVFLLGSKPGVAEDAASRLTAQYPGLTIAGCQHGYFDPDEEADLVSRISESAPDLLLVGMGCPRQEGFIAMHGARLNCPLLIGAGGTLEVLAGRKQRAPRLIQRLGLEWLWRSLIDPARWKRNLSLLHFVLLVLSAKRPAGEGA